MKNLPVLNKSTTTAQDCLVYTQRHAMEKGDAFIYSLILPAPSRVCTVYGVYNLYNNTLFNIHIIILFS